MPQDEFFFHSLLLRHCIKTDLLKYQTDLKKKKILVVGDVGLDQYSIGFVERISQEAPVPIVNIQKEFLTLGMSANVAYNLKSLNADVFLSGAIGNDFFGKKLKNILSSKDISDSFLLEEDTRSTIVKQRIMSQQQQMIRIDYENISSLTVSEENKVLELLHELESVVDGVIIEDYGKGFCTKKIFKNIFSLFSGKIIGVDPHHQTPLDYYENATFLTPNTREAELLSGISITDLNSLGKAGWKILEKTQAAFLLITRGSDGMALFHKNSHTVQLIPTYAKQVYDVSGAGDTVISVFLLSILNGLTTQDASIVSNIAAGIEVSKKGTATVSYEEINYFLERLMDKNNMFEKQKTISWE